MSGDFHLAPFPLALRAPRVPLGLLAMNALSDFDDDGPHTRPPRFYMPQEDEIESRRLAMTDPAPPPAERETLPPDPPAEAAAAEAVAADVARTATGTLLPSRAHTEPPKSGSFEAATRALGQALVELRGTRDDIARGMRSHETHLENISIEVRRFAQRVSAVERAQDELRNDVRRNQNDVRREIHELREELQKALLRLSELEARAHTPQVNNDPAQRCDRDRQEADRRTDPAPG